MSVSEHYTTAVVGAGKTMATTGHYTSAGIYVPGGEGGTGVGAHRSIQLHKRNAKEEEAKKSVYDMVADAKKSNKEHEATHSKKLANTQVMGWAEAMRGADYREYHRHLKHIHENVDKWGLKMPDIPPAPPKPPSPPAPTPAHKPTPYVVPKFLRGMSYEEARRQISELEKRSKTYGWRPASSAKHDALMIYEAMLRTGNIKA